jgi:hypothetical protein
MSELNICAFTGIHLIKNQSYTCILWTFISNAIFKNVMFMQKRIKQVPKLNYFFCVDSE